MSDVGSGGGCGPRGGCLWPILSPGWEDLDGSYALKRKVPGRGQLTKGTDRLPKVAQVALSLRTSDFGLFRRHRPTKRAHEQSTESQAVRRSRDLGRLIGYGTIESLTQKCRSHKEYDGLETRRSNDLIIRNS